MSNQQEIKKIVDDLVQMVVAGKTMEAFEKYYADDVVMQEPKGEPRKGKEENRKFEKEFLEGGETHEAKALSVATGDDLSMIEWYMDRTDKKYGRVKMYEVAVQRWKDGKIINEKFYYTM